MAGPGVAADPTELLERDHELERVDGLLERVVSEAVGGLLVIEGAPGLGKTSLLEAARRLAKARSLRWANARGHELEREFGYGVTRQLFEPLLQSLKTPERRRVLSGTAALARPVFELRTRPGANDPFAIVHGLYWLVAELAGQAPLALAIDDAHWSDMPSLRLVAYLANRLETLPVVIILATRLAPSGDAGDLLASLSAARGVEVLRLAPLGPDSIELLAHEQLRAEPDSSFVAECLTATGGNPFLVWELLGELRRDGIEPTAAAVERIGERAPAAVVRSVQARLAALGRPSARVARAMAVFGERAAPSLVAALAGVEPGAAGQATDTLVSAGILRGNRPPRFSHPMVMRAVYNDLAPGERSRAHRTAAHLLARAHADPEVVAAQLLLCDPAADREVTSQLLTAARAAARRGTPDIGTRYLTRALLEPPDPSDRLSLISELGRLELVLRRPSAIEHLGLALELSTDRVERALLAQDLADALAYAGAWDRAVPVLRRAIEELGEREPALGMRLRAVLGAIATHDSRFAHVREGMRTEIELLTARGGPISTPLLPVQALLLAIGGERCGEVAPLIERAHAHPVAARDVYDQQMLAGFSGYALLYADELAGVERFAHDLAEHAVRSGSVAALITASLFRAEVCLRTGRLVEAGAEARSALDLAVEVGADLPRPLLLACLTRCARERGEDDGVMGELLGMPLPADTVGTGLGFKVVYERGCCRIARGDRAGAIADMRLACSTAEPLSVRNPNVVPCLSTLALMIAEDCYEEAEDLSARELELARQSGLGRAIGVALRAQAQLQHGQQQLDNLQDSLSALESVDAPLELARTLIALGRAMRRQGQPKLARDPLRRALDLAERAGARPLAETARDEALAAGARPRRPWISGVEALTPSEIRVALLAADGQTTRDIAQALFITPKTVSDHLGSIYRKLDIHQRTDLARVLRQQRRP